MYDIIDKILNYKRNFVYNSDRTEFSKDEIEQLPAEDIFLMFKYISEGYYIECLHVIEINPVTVYSMSEDGAVSWLYGERLDYHINTGKVHRHIFDWQPF